MLTDKSIVFRVDASQTIGAGHVMRCVSLARELRHRGASIVFVCRQLDGHLGAWIENDGFDVCVLPERRSEAGELISRQDNPWAGASWEEDAADTIRAISRLDRKPDWLIVDHYQIGAGWETKLQSVVSRIGVIDDLANRKHRCELLLDQNAYLDAADRYGALLPRHCRSLLGPQFALLHSDYRHQRRNVSVRTGRVRRILISCGGFDSANCTGHILDALELIDLGAIQVDVVIGSLHRDRAVLESACSVSGYMCHVQTNRMAELMSDADMAIGTGGSSAWERCCLGVPCLTLVVADNQRKLVHDAGIAGILFAPEVSPAETEKLAEHIRSFIDNSALRESMSANAMAIVDGFGADRVSRALGVFSVKVREAEPEDSARIFAWRNSASIRNVSRDASPIARKTHDEWFVSVLEDPLRQVLIGELSDEAVGVVRFDMHDHEAEISIYLAPEQQGRGLGIELLLAAESWLIKKEPEMTLLKAEVLSDNQKSRSLFKAAGYSKSDTQFCKRLS